MRRTRLGLAALLGVMLPAGHAPAANPATFAITASMVQPPAVTVSKLVTPGAPGIGGPVTYAIVVTNTGTATVSTLTVTDTVAAQIVGVATAQPAAFAAPVVTSVTSGTRYDWGATGLTFGPGQSFTFTISGYAGIVCAPTPVPNETYVTATGPGGSSSVSDLSGAFTLAPHLTAITVVKSQIPAAPVSGGPVTYQIQVTNTGTSTIASLTVVDTVSAVLHPNGVQMTPAQPAPFGPPVVTGIAGSGTRYVWSASGLALAPGASMVFQLDGTVGTVPVSTVVSNTAFAVASAACAPVAATSNRVEFTLGPAVLLAGALGVSRTTVSVGQPFLVMLTVTNTGAGTATGTAATAWVSSGTAAAVFSGVSAPQVADIGAGASVIYTWTATATTAGTLQFSATATGAGVSTGAAVSPVVTVVTPASLVATAAIFPPAVCSGTTYEVRVTIRNTGQAAADNVVPFAVVAGGSPTYIAGPAPVPPVPLASGASQTFTWIYQAGGPGTETFTASATGTDANSGFPIESAMSGPASVTVNAGASLVAAFAAPPTASVGSPVTVTLTVTNVGDQDATGVAAAVTVGPGSGSFGAGTGPGTIAAGGSRTYSWTYTPSVAGSHVFTATATGVTCVSTPVSVSAGGSLAAAAPALLAGTLYRDGTPLVAGQVVTLVLSVTNAGGTSAVNVVPSAMAVSGPAQAMLIGPAGPLTLPAGGVQGFLYTATLTGAGTVTLTARADGQDANSKALVSTGPQSVVLSVAAPANIVVSAFTVPASVQSPNPVGVSVQVTNTGGTSAQVTAVTPTYAVDPASPQDPFALAKAPVVVPAVPVIVAPGGTALFSYTYNPTVCGSASPFVDVTWSDAGTGAGPFTTPKAVRHTVAFGLASSIYLVSEPARAEAGSLAQLSVLVLDNCWPAPVPVGGAQVELVVLSGGGRVLSPSGVTDAAGAFGSQFRLGDAAGANLIEARLLSGTAVVDSDAVTVTGTARETFEPFLSKNFFDPGRGERVQIRIHVPRAVTITVRVFNLAGEMVRHVRDAEVLPGVAAWEWDGRNDENALVANGVYFIQVVAGGEVSVKRVIVLKR